MKYKRNTFDRKQIITKRWWGTRIYKKRKYVRSSYFILSIVFFMTVYTYGIVIYVYNYRNTRNNNQIIVSVII